MFLLKVVHSDFFAKTVGGGVSSLLFEVGLDLRKTNFDFINLVHSEGSADLSLLRVSLGLRDLFVNSLHNLSIVLVHFISFSNNFGIFFRWHIKELNLHGINLSS